MWYWCKHSNIAKNLLYFCQVMQSWYPLKTENKWDTKRIQNYQYLKMEQTEVKKVGSVLLFNLHPLSKLRIYLANITGVDQSQYSLQELLEILRDIIHTERMISTSNPICPQNSEQAVDSKTLYVSEIRDIICSHLTENSVKSVDTAPALCLHGMHQTGVTMGHTAPAIFSSHHAPRKKGDNNSRPKENGILKPRHGKTQKYSSNKDLMFSSQLTDARK